MPIEIRPITEDEYPVAFRTLQTTFSSDVDDESLETERLIFEFDRSLAAYDSGAMVGLAGAYSFDMTLPGGAMTPVAGVTWVGVLPTHRRRGIQRSLMERQLDDVAARDESIAVLTASEAVIYGRYGYGVGSHFVKAELRTDESAFGTEARAGGRIRLIDTAEARKVLPGLHTAWRAGRPGLLSRSERWWDLWAKDVKEWRDGASARFIAVHEDDAGRADGFATYRVKSAWAPERPGGTILVIDLTSADDEVTAALVRFILDIDLMWDVHLQVRPLDDPIRWRLANSRNYRVTQMNDWLWVRLLDLPAALAARRYATEGRVAIGITDPFRPANDGVYVVEGGPDGATCERAADGTEADVRMPVESLGAAYLGGVSFTTLAAAGRAAGDPAALAAADRLFLWHPLPFCDLPF